MRAGTKDILIDTNIMIAFFKEEADILKRFSEHEKLNVSCITVGELFLGANLSGRKERNLQRTKEILSKCHLIDINHAIAYQYARIKAQLRTIGRPLPDNDLWIAATAKEHNMVIVTRDKHFSYIDDIMIEIW